MFSWKNDISENAVTPEHIYRDRRRFLAQVAAGGLLAYSHNVGSEGAGGKIASAQKLQEKPNTWEEITNYNNYYEFGVGKDDPAKHAHRLTIKPWTVRIDGLVDKPGDYQFETILAAMTIEERIYRFRCVEAWSMIIPFNGFMLRDLINMVQVQSNARFVAFDTVLRADEMRGVAYPVIDWPYREGLRLDEAMHPLTILATGIYGRDIPKQNGAPLRLVVPWKYGFKSIKSIVRITLTDTQPPTSWNMSNAREYGFYSNVNPHVDHPRWSQATERRIGSGLFAKRIPTQLFNGYGEQVAHMYKDMDLAVYF